MTEADIAELFIQAAETERKLPRDRETRQSWGGYCLAWVHTRDDIADRRRTNDRGESLERGDDPLESWRVEWMEEWRRRASNAQVSAWEACLQITAEFLTDAGQRRALWAWAFAKATDAEMEGVDQPNKPRRISFARWCREVENVAEITGHRRKNRALAAIAQGICGKRDLHDETFEKRVLPHTPETEHVFATVEGRHAVYDTKRVHSWRDDPSFTKTTGLSLKEWRAAKRRQQSARRRQAA